MLHIKLLPVQSKFLGRLARATPMIQSVSDGYRQFHIVASPNSDYISISLERSNFRMGCQLDCIVKDVGSSLISQDVLRKIAPMKGNIDICVKDSQVQIVSVAEQRLSFPYVETGNIDLLPGKTIQHFEINHDELGFLIKASKIKKQKALGRISFLKNRIQILDECHLIQKQSNLPLDNVSAISADFGPLIKELFPEFVHVEVFCYENAEWLRFRNGASFLEVKTVSCPEFQVLPIEQTVATVIDREQLTQQLKTLTPIVAAQTKKIMRPTPVEISVHEESLVFTVSNNDFVTPEKSKYTQSVMVDASGPAHDPVYMNLTYLKESLSLLTGDTISVDLSEDGFFLIQDNSVLIKIGLLLPSKK